MSPEKNLDKCTTSSKSAKKRVFDVVRSLLPESAQQVTRLHKKIKGPATELAEDLKRPGLLTRGREDRQQQLFQEAVGLVQDASPQRYLPSKRKREESIFLTEQISQKELMDTLRREADKSLQLAYLLEKAKPDLPAGVKLFLDQLKKIERDIQRGKGNSLSGEEYVQLIKSTLEKLSPETMKEYQNYNVTFGHGEGGRGIQLNCGDQKDQWQVKFHIQRKKQVQLVLRAIDQLLEFDQAEKGVVPSPQRRMEIAARVFKANENLGERYGWSIRGYDLAKQYREYYYDGIYKAFKKGSINSDTSKNKLREIGHKYACKKLIDSIATKPDEAKQFPNMFPATYFQERLRAIKERHKPVRVGTEEFENLTTKMQERKKQGKNGTLIVNILLNKELQDEEIWTQPYFLSKDIRSPHSVNTRGNPCTFAGEVEIEGKKLLRIKDQSGHFRTVDEDKQDPLLVLNYAVKVFEAQGFDTSEVKREQAKFHPRVGPFVLPYLEN